MALKFATHKAAALRDIWNILVGGTWAAGDKVHIAMPNKTLNITLGANNLTVADVTRAIAIAWNAQERMNGLGTPDASSDFGGQEFGEFAEAKAEHDNTANVKLIGVTPGQPITISSVTETGAAGTVTLTHPQVATGPQFMNASGNWHPSLPVDGDTIVLRDSERWGFRYGFIANISVNSVIHNSWRGWLGNPPTNIDDPNKPYPEYRELVPDFNNSASALSGIDFMHLIGIGPGEGSQFLGFQHRDVHATNRHRIYMKVFKTNPTPLYAGLKVLNTFLFNNTANSLAAIDVEDGMVYLGVLTGSHAFTNDLNFQIKNLRVIGGDVQMIDNNLAITIRQAGGRLELGSVKDTLSPTYVVKIEGGDCYFQDLATLGTVDVDVAKSGRVIWNSEKSFDSMDLSGDAIFDAEQDHRPIASGANIKVYDTGVSFLDGLARIAAYPNGIQTVGCDLGDLRKVRLGINRVIGSIANI